MKQPIWIFSSNNLAKLRHRASTRVTWVLAISCVLLLAFCSELERNNPVDPEGNVASSTWAPRNVTTEVVNIHYVQIAWEYSSDIDIDGFIISKWIQNHEEQKTIIAYPAGSERSYTDTTTELGVHYNYEILAHIGAVESAAERVDILPSYTLNTPTNVLITRPDITSLAVTWTDQSEDEDYFVIQSKMDTTEWDSIASVAANEVSYTDTGLTINTMYFYRIMAKNQYGTSNPSGEVSMYTLYEINAPDEVNIHRDDFTTCTISWSDESDNETAFILESKLDAADWQEEAVLPANTTSHTVEEMEVHKQYGFRVKARTPYGDSGYSNEPYIVMSFDLPAPSNLTLTRENGADIRLIWTDNTSNETGFIVQRATSMEDWTELTTLTPNVYTYVDQNLTVDETYRYRVQATHEYGSSDWCEEQSLYMMPETGTVTDIDGNVYLTVRIGDQMWMAENLRVTRYQNGDLIDHAADSLMWTNALAGAYCYLNNDDSYADTYGALYNGHAVLDERNIAPENWHVATDDDWQQLIEFLGADDAGTKLKSTSGWFNNGNGTDDYDFSALPAGYRYSYAPFRPDTWDAWFWSATWYGGNMTYAYSLWYGNDILHRYWYDNGYGLSVRCVRD